MLLINFSHWFLFFKVNLCFDLFFVKEEAAQFYWRQTPEDLEMWFYILPGPDLYYMPLFMNRNVSIMKKDDMKKESSA